MEKLQNEKRVATVSGQKEIGNYTAYVRYENTDEVMPASISASINHAGDAENNIPALRLTVSINTETMKCATNINNMEDATTSFSTAAELVEWISTYAAELAATYTTTEESEVSDED